MPAGADSLAAAGSELLACCPAEHLRESVDVKHIRGNAVFPEEVVICLGYKDLSAIGNLKIIHGHIALPALS